MLVLGLAAAGACVEVNGGAVELSWSLRTFEDTTTSCAQANVNEIRLIWEDASDSPDGGNRPGTHADFDCVENRGVTGFDVPEGDQLLRVQPICEDGNPATEHTYEVPPPILRQVRAGEVVTLNSLLVVVGCQNNTGCTCAPRSSMVGNGWQDRGT